MATGKPPDGTIKTPPGDPKHQEELLDEAIEETFPASDPVSISIERPEPDRAEPAAGKPKQTDRTR